MINENFFEALNIIYRRLSGISVPWAFTGSFGMALQGMDVEVNDIDIQTSPDGAYAIERQLSAFITKPVSFSSSDQIRSHFGKLNINSVEVEIMGGFQKKINESVWEPAVDVNDHITWIDYEDMHIPVLSLEYEYQAYKQLGRLEKANKLKDWLSRSDVG